MRLLALVFISILFSQCGTTSKTASTKKGSLDHLVGWMEGSFDSSAQAQNDTTYFDISLAMCPIWEEEKATRYLYVEQSLTRMPEKPYRQRVYAVTDLGGGKFASAVYTIEDDSLYIGGCKKGTLLNGLKKEMIATKEGCTVYLEYKGGKYEGSTKEKECKSTLYGASYATSEVIIKEGQVYSWDRGFDDKDEHIWGAKEAGYYFDASDK